MEQENKYNTALYRIVAVIIDILLLAFISYIMSLLTGAVNNYWIESILIIIDIIFYVGLVLKYGGTPGKLLMDLKIVMNKDDSPVTLKASVIRFLPYFLISIFNLIIVFLISTSNPQTSIGDILEYIPQIILLFSEFLLVLTWYIAQLISVFVNLKHRAIHDLMADTVVIRTK